MDDCRWERAGCSYCGDGSLDELPLAVDPEGNFQTLPEVCDGSDYDPEALDAKIGGSSCSELHENARLIVDCSDDCLDIIPQVDLEQPCCLKQNSLCPPPGDTLRCCYETENPQEAEACRQTYDTPAGAYSYVCK